MNMKRFLFIGSILILIASGTAHPETAADCGGNIYVADSGNNRVQRYVPGK